MRINFYQKIICPECKQGTSIITITDDKVKFKCNQNHCIEIPKNEFKKSQMITQSKKKKYCLACKENICSCCEKVHIKYDNNHLIIDDDEKDYLCLEHNNNKNPFIFYCKTCQKNLCWICWDYHKNHQIEALKEIYFFIDKLIAKQKAYSSILKKFDQLHEELLKIRDNFKYTYEMNEIIIKNYNVDNRNYTKLCNYKEIYEKNFNLQKINKMVTILSNITKNNINYQEINFNISSNNIEKEEKIKVQNQEIKECNFFISYNKSQFLKSFNVSHNSFNIQRFYEKIENNNEQKNNIDIIKNGQNIREDEKQTDEGINKINNLKSILPSNEKINENENVNKIEKENDNGNEEQYNEDISESKVNNNTKSIEYSDEINNENNGIKKNKIIYNKKEKKENEGEKNIISCKKKEIIEEQYNNGNKNDQRSIKRNKDKNSINSIKMIYRNKDNKEIIRILGRNFVKINKNKCHIIFENEIYELTEKFKVKNNKEYLVFYLEGIDKITDASEMFRDCRLLINLDDISKWDTSNIINMNRMFMNCESLSFPDISKWNLVNVINIEYMFYGCKFLKELPDLSAWNTNNIINMSHLFQKCESLLNLPELSKWNFRNVTNMEYMFCGCKSLKNLPDISTWNTNNVIDMSYLFENCHSLKSLPDISKWNVKNVENMECMFFCCLRLKTIEIFKKVDKVEDISYLYFGCDSLEKEPDLKEWNLNKIKKKENFNGNCFKLKKKINLGYNPL